MAILTETLAFRIPVGIKDKINNLALTSHRKKSDILLAWITEKLELES
jgi:predicted DNA-binding protein